MEDNQPSTHAVSGWRQVATPIPDAHRRL